LTKNQVQSGLKFPVRRVDLVREDNTSKHTNKQAVIHIPTDKRLGIVNSTRINISYEDTMKWLWTELDTAGYPYKIKDSVITSSGDLYQEYIFDYKIATPDNEIMAPLLIVKASHVNKPLEILFGTYRFVCSNGVIVGDTIQKMTVGAGVKELIPSVVADEIRIKFLQFAKVADLYKKLELKPFTDYLSSILLDQYIGTKIKKEVLSMLVKDNDIELTKSKIRSSDLKDPDSLIRVVNSIDSWAFYNIVTNVATFAAKGVNTRTKNYNRISQIFGV